MQIILTCFSILIIIFNVYMLYRLEKMSKALKELESSTEFNFFAESKKIDLINIEIDKIKGGNRYVKKENRRVYKNRQGQSK